MPARRRWGACSQPVGSWMPADGRPGADAGKRSRQGARRRRRVRPRVGCSLVLSGGSGKPGPGGPYVLAPTGPVFIYVNKYLLNMPIVCGPGRPVREQTLRPRAAANATGQRLGAWPADLGIRCVRWCSPVRNPSGARSAFSRTCTDEHVERGPRTRTFGCERCATAMRAPARITRAACVFSVASPAPRLAPHRGWLRRDQPTGPSCPTNNRCKSAVLRRPNEAPWLAIQSSVRCRPASRNRSNSGWWAMSLLSLGSAAR